MNMKQSSEIHFPTSKDKGAVPFPCSPGGSANQQAAEQTPTAGEQPDADKKGAADAAPAEPELTAEELRLMADTMPGDGPGD